MVSQRLGVIPHLPPKCSFPKLIRLFHELPHFLAQLFQASHETGNSQDMRLNTKFAMSSSVHVIHFGNKYDKSGHVK
jgi:hypothetical protein